MSRSVKAREVVVTWKQYLSPDGQEVYRVQFIRALLSGAPLFGAVAVPLCKAHESFASTRAKQILPSYPTRADAQELLDDYAVRNELKEWEGCHESLG